MCETPLTPGAGLPGQGRGEAALRSPPAIVEPPRSEQPLKTSAKKPRLNPRHRPAATFSYYFFFSFSFPFPLSRCLICCYYQPFPYGHFN